jgi:exopolysaccharide biosynthesis polyprenyl glycosylphosphotransferase
LGVSIAGFVDEQWSGSASFRLSGRQLVSDLKNLASFLRHHVVDEIVIALPTSVLNKHRVRLLDTCRAHGIMVRFPASLLIDAGIDALGQRPADEIVMTVYNGSVEGWDPVAKRLLDVALAFILLALAAPLMALIAVLIKGTSAGPVLFTQERMGLNKRRFRMHKFRTMYVGSEERLRELEHLNEMEGPTFKVTRDPRITPLGRFLRRSSLDELPQLLHVLKGEMSLVGPRPLALRDVNLFGDDRHRRRFGVRPGMTGLWQISGRSLIPFEDWMELDLRYVDEWSLGLDLKILLKTIPVVLSGKGAL